MPKINILTEETANKIAAGELIERPSSVVKELVENSIDSGARRISVELIGGGKTLIRVTDDGCGMSHDDALLCLERHATSKISSASDLDSIMTFGFRGEAIPSIASVSKMEIVTRTPDSISGTYVAIEGGVLKSVSERGAPVGTQVTVRRIFLNTPARLKFMKSVATELGHVINMLQRQALAHPALSFRLMNGEHEALNLPPAASIADRLAVVWGNEIAADLRCGRSGGDGLSVCGYFGTPALTRSNRDHQFFFINRRPITNRLLGKALADAYRGAVMNGRFPVAFVFVEIDSHMVDVNIHPTKREVRFAEPDRVCDELQKACRAAFEAGRRKIGATKEHAAKRILLDADATGQREVAASEAAVVRPAATASPGISSARTPLSEQPLFRSIRIDEGDLASALVQVEDDERPSAPILPIIRPTADFSSVSPNVRLVTQIFNAYLLCVEEDDLIIIDQHALHERILYDELVERGNRSGAVTQKMLIPLTIELPPDRAEILSAHMDIFSRVGIEIEPFGTRTFAIAALASVHSEKRVLEIVREGVDELYLGLRMKAPREILERLMTISACKNSIKSGDPLTGDEAEMLLDGLKILAQPPTCLHGRPLVLRLT
ncbi:MAG: DNA mismatch repair endonuclease MutL [Candidatus Lindowbacteria bacterium]|nr:DNA mismatch repair endonuclease MutL [Candidatus Lindowbacteria bacterium]